MTTVIKILRKKHISYFNLAYSFLAFLLVFTAFMQMPLAKRYFIADLPGMSWTANYLFTHHLYYTALAVLTGLVSYKFITYMLDTEKEKRISTGGLIKAMSLSGLMLTGIIKTVSQSWGILYSQDYMIFINFIQLSFTLIFIISSLAFIKSPEKWVTQKAETQSELHRQ